MKIHGIYCIENIFNVQDFFSNLRLPSKTEFFRKIFTVQYWIYFLSFKIFEQLCAYPEKQSLPWKFSLYSIYFLHSGILSNLRLPWIRCIEYIFLTVTCGEVRDWAGTISCKAKFASVWIEWSSVNSPLNWLLAEWLLLMLSIPYHNLLHTYSHNGDSRFKKSSIKEDQTEVTCHLTVLV